MESKTNKYVYNGKTMCHRCYLLCRKRETKARLYGVFSLACKSWTCDICGKKKAYKYAKTIEQAFERTACRFMTLTMANVDDRLACIKLMAACWNRLRIMIERKWGKIKYARVLELSGEKERPHYHILLDRYINYKWLSEAAYKCGFGKIVDIRLAKNKEVVKYVCKYLSKDLANVDDKKAEKIGKYRKVVCSRDIKLGGKGKSGWEFLRVIKKEVALTPKMLQEEMRDVHKEFGGTVQIMGGVNYKFEMPELEEVNLPTCKVEYHNIGYWNHNQPHVQALLTKNPCIKKVAVHHRPEIKLTPREWKICEVLHRVRMIA